MTYVAVDDVSPLPFCDNSNTAWPAQAQTAFEAAVAIWETRIVSSVPIRVTANWTSCLGGDTLGSAGPSFFCSLSGVYYPAALRDAIAGADICSTGSAPDIYADFSSSFSWYFMTDGSIPPPGQVDFMSVVLHELTHGLGFVDSFGWSSNTGSWGLGPNQIAVRYDQFVANGSSQVLINSFLNNSSALGNELTSNNLFWSGANGTAANGGIRPRLYAPNPFEPGSSIAHLDEATYPNGTANSLMTPSIAWQEVVHDPGPITLGIFQDLGWMTNTATAPGTPTLNNVVALDSTTLRVDWSPGSPAGTEVHIEHALPYQAWAFLAADAVSPYDHTGLPANSTHCYRLQAHDHTSGLFSPYSNWTCVTTPAGGNPPGAPTLTSVVPVNSTTLRVNWSFGTLAGTEVHIEHALPNQPWQFLTGDAVSPYDHSGLAAGSTHCYRLLAHDHGTNLVSAYSGWTCVATSSATPPGAPTLTSVVALSSTSLRLNWSYGSPPGTEVHIEHALPYQAWSFLAGDSASPYDHTGLAANSTHCYRLQAHDHGTGLLSPYSNWICGTTQAGPGAPGAPTITSVVPLNSTTLRVNWSYGSPTGTEIHIEHALPYQAWAFLDADTASPYDHTGLTSGSTHCYRALAHDHGSGLVSSYSNFTCVPLP